MARARTGTLVLKASGYFARVRVDLRADDGAPLLDDDGKHRGERRWFDLETRDVLLARRKLVKLVRLLDEGRVEAVARETLTKPETVEERAVEWVAVREKRGVVMASDERRMLVEHVYPLIGPHPYNEVRRLHIKQILAGATNKGYSKGSVGHVRRMLVRLFNAGIEDEVIGANPCTGVKVPEEAKEDLRPRTLPTDEEMSAIFSTTTKKVTTEIRLVALVARELGGARTCEVNRLDWLSVDRLHFRGCILPRGKRGAPQQLDLPEDVASNLAAWWVAQGRPERGPVFPVERGPRAGQFKKGGSYAKRLRRAFLDAGVIRRELHDDTPHSRRCDFHTLRRVYVTALAGANVNEQRAMRLAGHSSSATHKRYTLDTPEMRSVPIAALPPQGIVVWTPASDQSRRSTADHSAIPTLDATGTDDAPPSKAGAISNTDSPSKPVVAGSSPAERADRRADRPAALQAIVYPPRRCSSPVEPDASDRGRSGRGCCSSDAFGHTW